MMYVNVRLVDQAIATYLPFQLMWNHLVQLYNSMSSPSPVVQQTGPQQSAIAGEDDVCTLETGQSRISHIPAISTYVESPSPVVQQNVICRTGSSKRSKMPTNLKGSTAIKLKEADCDGVYVATHACVEAEQVLVNIGIVILIGTPGSGKSTIGYNIMGNVKKSENRIPSILTCPSEFDDIPIPKPKEKVEPGNRFVIMIDDIYGKSNLVTEFQRSWEMKFDTMWSLVERGFIKLIITFRKQIFAECEESLKVFTAFRKSHQMDLHSPHLCLTSEEKLTILERHLKHASVTLKEDDRETAVNKTFNELGFPQCCKFFVGSREAQKQGVKFFENPILYLRSQFEQLKSDRSEQSQFQYLVLLVVMFKQGILKDDCLDPFEDQTDTFTMLNKLKNVCRIKCDVSLGQIKASADSLCGLYLQHNDKEYSFIHQSVFDVLFLQFSAGFLKQAIIICPLPMMLQYIITPGVTKKGDITVVVEEDNFSVLAKRFTGWLKSSSARSILSHQSFRDEQFVKYLIEEFWRSEVPTDILYQQLDHQSHRIETVFDESDIKNIWKRFEETEGYFSSDFLSKIGFFHQNEMCSSSSVACVAVMEGFHILSRYFVEELCKLKGSAIEDQKKEVFDASCLVGNAEVTNILLKSGIFPTKKSLTAAAASQSDDSLLFDKLLNHKKDFTLNVNELGSLLFLAIEKGNGKISSLLIDEIRRMESCDPVLEMAAKQLLIQCHEGFRNQHIIKLKMIELPSSLRVGAVDLFKKLSRYTCIQSNKPEVCASLAAAFEDVGILKEIIQTHPACLSKRNGDGTLLHTAACYGCVDSVCFLLEHGLNIADANKNQLTALHLAAEHNTSNVVKCLLNKGADPNMEYAIKNSPLHLAVKSGSLDSVKILVEMRAKLNSLNDLGENPLHCAAKDNSVNFVKYLVDAGSDINVPNASGMIPLHLAVHFNNAEVVQCLILKGSDLKRPCTVAYVEFWRHNRSGCFDTINFLFNKRLDKSSSLFAVLLHRAVRSGAITSVRLLLEKGVHPDSLDADSKSPLNIASRSRCVQMICLLLKHKASVNSVDKNQRSPLHEACFFADLPTVKILLKHGANPKLEDKDGLTPLHLGLEGMKGEVDIIQILINGGANIDSQDKKGFTCLHKSVLNENATKELIRLKADVNKPDNDGQTPLFHAVLHNMYDQMKLLIDAKSDINKQDNSMQTPLHLATVLQQPETVSLLLQAKADPYLLDCNGLTCMHHASTFKNSEILQVLLENNLNPDCLDRNNQTPLFKACLLNQETHVQLLIEKGASVGWKDNNCQTALHLTSLYGHVNLMKRVMDTEVDACLLDAINLWDNQITPLMLACLFENLEMVTILLDKGADPNHRCEDLTAMHIAAEVDDRAILESLLKKGGQRNIISDGENKPIKVAVSKALRKQLACRFESFCVEEPSLLSMLDSVKTLLNQPSTCFNKKDPRTQDTSSLESMCASSSKDKAEYKKTPMTEQTAEIVTEKTDLPPLLIQSQKNTQELGTADDSIGNNFNGYLATPPCRNTHTSKRKPATENVAEEKKSENQFDLPSQRDLMTKYDEAELKPPIENVAEENKSENQFDLPSQRDLMTKHDEAELKPPTKNVAKENKSENQFDLPSQTGLMTKHDEAELKPPTENVAEEKEVGNQFDLPSQTGLMTKHDEAELKPPTENGAEEKKSESQSDQMIQRLSQSVNVLFANALDYMSTREDVDKSVNASSPEVHVNFMSLSDVDIIRMLSAEFVLFKDATGIH